MPKDATTSQRFPYELCTARGATAQEDGEARGGATCSISQQNVGCILAQIDGFLHHAIKGKYGGLEQAKRHPATDGYSAHKGIRSTRRSFC